MEQEARKRHQVKEEQDNDVVNAVRKKSRGRGEVVGGGGKQAHAQDHTPP